MSVESALEYIHSVKWQGAKPGLERTRELLGKLGNPEKALKFIHVAGTNGKGSTSAMIASALRAAGYKTGLYTSPYILRFNERMQINGEPISDGELEEMTELIRSPADSMTDSPTEFELITALAMLYFKRADCDAVVLEAGLGGELDSTNVIATPELAVITAMGLDHTAELGETLTEIASAKAGIIKPGGEAVVYGAEPEALRVFEKRCRDVGAALTRTDFSRLRVKRLSLDGAEFDFAPLRDVRIPLAGTYQPKNAALAITALEALRRRGYKISDEDILNGLACVKWPGRFEVLCRDPVFIVDGAHNPHGIAAAADSIKELFAGKLVFLVGVMADKDVRAMAEAIAPLARAFVAVAPPNPRAMKASELAGLLAEYGVPAEACGSVRDGAGRAMKLAGAGGAVAALGSLYFSADVRDAVKTWDKERGGL
ncbi:MAG: bifunctional folylpolyglutamate synthase/dihydrofolate synthase [Oscillospiraceae bacterium]|jgi:dihydrofolate synthase/folylpolyglutamate synthase|nr:bifunctional folylpolyglutamate synthase/dihydrofolate synthase [Oscillospiraceae bacterium]